MNIEAMKQALEALQQAIAEAEDAVAAEREACAQACEDLIGTRAMARHCADAIRARGEWVKTYAGGKPNYTTPQVRTHTPEDVKKIESKWIGLDNEMMRNTTLEFNRGALWAERYLKERNHEPSHD